MTVAVELLRSGRLVHGLRLAPLALATAAIVALHLLDRSGPADPTAALRLVGLMLALGSGFVLDDAAAPTLQSSPYSLARRLWLRIACAAVVITPLWTIAVVWVLRSSPEPQASPDVATGLTIEFVAALTLVWAAAAWGRRRGFDEPGIATAPLLLVVLFVAATQRRAPMFVGPGPGWLAAHLRWSGVLACAALLLVAAVRDPAARRRRGHPALPQVG